MKRDILSDSFSRSSLEVSSVGDFNIMEVGIQGILSDIWNLSSLVELSLNNCNLKEGKILNHICHLSSLEELSLDGSHFSSIHARITRLSNLRALNLGRCKKLQEIPELPSSLRRLKYDFHSTGLLLLYPLDLHSAFVQEPQISLGASDFGRSIFIPRSSGILEGTKNQIVDTLLIKYQCDCPDDDDGSVSDLVWVTYYPKHAIKKQYHSNQWTHFLASFKGYITLKTKDLQCLELLGAGGLDSNRVLVAIQSDDCHLSSWEALNRSINYFSSIIPISVIQLSKLRVLHLSHCQKLLQIPELPPSLRTLDVHACPYLETLSRPSTQITIELPMDWYQNNDFLGFALYSVYVSLHIESKEDPCGLKCKLNFHGGLLFRSSHLCHHNGDELNGVWVAYYPKVAISNQYKSNKWRHFKASFHGYLGNKQVKECGFHLIHMPKIYKGIKRDHTPILIQYPDVQRCCGTKSVAEDIDVNG
ncbi:hypothetical protein AAG906_035611 [Vitis piasezkii]